MKPSKGRVVFVLVAPETNNGDDYAPAMITRVWNDTCVNVRVLCDSMNTPWMTSVKLLATREEAEREPGASARAYWPPRV